MHRIICRTLAILCMSTFLPLSTHSVYAQQKERAKLAEADDRIFAIARKSLASFRSETPKKCGSEHLKKAAQFAAHVIREGARREFGAGFILRAGSEYLDVADEAKKAGCQAVARLIYDEVIKGFIAPSHAALRQRAQIGIDDLRR